MAFDLGSLSRSSETKKPAIIVVNGDSGIGKTTFASFAPNPVFIPCEDGLASVDVQHFPKANTFDDVMQAIGTLYEDEHPFKSVVLDTLDHMEPLIFAQVCRDNGWANIEQPGYGKGYAAAMILWHQYFEAVRMLRDERGMWIVQIAHSAVKRFDPPDSESYERYVIKLKDRAADLVREKCDIMLFMKLYTSIKQTDAGGANKRNRALGSDQRVVYTTEKPSHQAKNRYGLPPEILVNNGDWQAVWDKIHECVGL